jgi:3-oxoacyl-[acyl-carrier-protein] synthase-3
MLNTVITGIGSYIPPVEVTNEDFLHHEFYSEDGQPITAPTSEVVNKLEAITGIRARRYAEKNQNTSDIAAIAARHAIEDAGVDPETIDQIIVAQNFGDMLPGSYQPDMLPSIASRVKYALGIKNIHCVAYDVIFGCPGWIQGFIQADAYFKAGVAKKALVIGADTLSRITDPHDRDAMIFADGAGAVVLEAREEAQKRGVLATAAITHSQEDTYYLKMDGSYKPGQDEKQRYIKMQGRKIYEYALTYVPQAMMECLKKAGVEDIHEVKKIFIHQANEKMDEAIIKRLFRLYGARDYDTMVAPMNIHDLGNSSVATIPTLLDMVYRRVIPGQELNEGDLLLFASVGAGMNINAIAYRY